MSTSPVATADATASATPSIPPPRPASSSSSVRPSRVGIHGLELYFPRRFVSQSNLEKHYGVSAGKYTIGLGQEKLAFCNDREDIYSICLSAVSRFMSNNHIPYSWVGRLEVASETILDHSKSIKTYLMSLFEAEGNNDVEGIDCMNACYAGTNALLNSVAWVESSSWDGRYAMVIAADIAEYASGPARPTGGCGAVVMLIGPDAQLEIEPTRGSHFEHAFDFYKPFLSSPYPVVDGKFSNSCYLRSLDKCFEQYRKKYEMRNDGKKFYVLRDAQHVVFHAPYNKLVQKSFARLLYNEYMAVHDDRDAVASNASASSDSAIPSLPESFSTLDPYRSLARSSSYADVGLEKTAVALSKSYYESMVSASTFIPKNLGNMYTASLYAGLISLLAVKLSSNEPSSIDQLEGQRIMMFSYGSGLASTLFSIRVGSGPAVRDQLSSMVSRMNVLPRLNDRTESTPSEFDEWMLRREKLHHPTYEGKAFQLEGEIDTEREMFDGAFVLMERDEQGKRSYQQVGKSAGTKTA